MIEIRRIRWGWWEWRINGGQLDGSTVTRWGAVREALREQRFDEARRAPWKKAAS